MKPIVFLLFATITTIHAQTATDSISLHNAKWDIQEIGRGIKWRKTHFQEKQLFNANQSINILEIPIKSRKHRWAVVTADSLDKKNKARGQLRPTSTLAKENQTLLAINGGFFDVKNGGSVDFVKVNGKVVDTTRAQKGTEAAFHGQAAVVIHHNRLRILKGASTVGWEYTLPYQNVMLSGPLLRLNGADEVLPKNPFNDNRHPRSCVCITDTRKVLLITVDGRSAESYGMNLAELTFLARQLGCRDALNLDGGGSTTLWIEGKGVVNYPSDNKKFDHEGERAVSNALVLKQK